MKFSLFQKILFEVPNPIALIETFCFQSDFYSSYDIIKDKKIDDVNRIGARIGLNLLPRCDDIVVRTKNLGIFHCDLEEFLAKSLDVRRNYIDEFNDQVINELLKVKEGKQSVGLSKATKLLHTFYPEIIPILDNPLQKLYHSEIDRKWKLGKSQIFGDYYENLRTHENQQNLRDISETLSKNHLNLTKIRIFDILWWSYLKSKNLNLRLKKSQEETIRWTTIIGES
jgi:hypothetical protein